MVMVIFMKNHHVKWGIPELDGHMGYAMDCDAIGRKYESWLGSKNY